MDPKHDLTPVSFTVDHIVLKQGIYLTSKTPGIYTYDLRLVEPARAPEAALSPAVSHTLEHCMAAFFRACDGIKDEVIYVGPMGCLTGFYLVTARKYPESRIRDLLVECLEWVLTLETVPAMNRLQCGNPALGDLDGAKGLCRELIPAFRTCTSFAYPYLKEKSE